MPTRKITAATGIVDRLRSQLEGCASAFESLSVQLTPTQDDGWCALWRLEQFAASPPIAA